LPEADTIQKGNREWRLFKVQFLTPETQKKTPQLPSRVDPCDPAAIA
jgi:hypothetical protein